jgi:hypothetical protein
MKNLELNSMETVEEEEMAPRDMAAKPAQPDEDDVVSIDSQPESHKRPRSPVADDQRESSEFTRILEEFAADKLSRTEKPRMD